MEEHSIVVNGKVIKTALDSLKQDAPYLLSDGQKQKIIYFRGIAPGREGEGPTLWFRVKQGYIYTDHWLDLGKAKEVRNLSLYTLPKAPPLGS